MTSTPKVVTVRAVNREPGMCSRYSRTSCQILRASRIESATTLTTLINRIQGCRRMNSAEFCTL